jgi:hypothetical protein
MLRDFEVPPVAAAVTDKGTQHICRDIHGYRMICHYRRYTIKRFLRQKNGKGRQS